VAVRWSGRDVPRAGVEMSGIARYELWRSIDGRRARRLLTTRRTSRRVAVRAGTRYGFFTVAVDRAGNRERRPTRPDARLTTPG
jgi:serine protease